MKKNLFDLSETASLIGVDVETVKDFISCGDLAAVGSGKALVRSATLTVSSALIMKRISPVSPSKLQIRRLIWLISATVTVPFIGISVVIATKQHFTLRSPTEQRCVRS